MKGLFIGKKSPLYGKVVSEETKRKMSLAKKGLYDGGKSYKAVKVMNLITEEVFDCIKIAAEKSGIKPSTLRAALNKEGSIYLNLKKLRNG